MSEQQERERHMREMARLVDEYLKDVSVLPECWALIVWPAQDGALSNYIANSKRAEIIDALRLTADRLESRMDMPPSDKRLQ